MKKLRILITILAIGAFSAQGVYAQEKKQGHKEEKKEVYKTTKEKTPVQVKESLKGYSNNYKIANEVTYVRKNDVNVYKFRVEKGNWSHYLLISEKGKIMGIETGEH